MCTHAHIHTHMHTCTRPSGDILRARAWQSAQSAPAMGASCLRKATGPESTWYHITSMGKIRRKRIYSEEWVFLDTSTVSMWFGETQISNLKENLNFFPLYNLEQRTETIALRPNLARHGFRKRTSAGRRPGLSAASRQPWPCGLAGAGTE